MADERMSEEEIAQYERTFSAFCVVDGDLAQHLLAELRRERARADEAAKREREACAPTLPKRLPARPWAVHVYQCEDGDTNYQIQAAGEDEDGGQVIANLCDSDFDRAGAAKACAETIVALVNASSEVDNG